MNARICTLPSVGDWIPPAKPRRYCPVLCSSAPAGWIDRLEDQRRCGPCQQFRNEIEPQAGPWELAHDRGADGDGRVEGRARKLADGECASQDREADRAMLLTLVTVSRSSTLGLSFVG